MIKISIITVCYNSAATLEKTILSVANQTYSNIEYIIVDGNSKDETVDIIKKQEDKITKWISEPDKGLYDAMNKGISMATGDIIGILNSDDTFFSNEILADMDNAIVVYPEGIKYNPLSAKNVIRWILGPANEADYSTYSKTDVIYWYMDYYLSLIHI